MKKLIALTAALAMAAAGASFADPTDVAGLGTVEASESGVIIDGAEGNPDPLDGYITADGNGVCASDEGSPYDEVDDGATCGP